jgi:tRNA/tmRNA/rRNA uracil-C5-methylase (TrmA/RlmC/RlmD family)
MLCHGSVLDYEDELRLKSAALGEFWRLRGLPGELQRIVPSPRPRGYRTVSKRKILAGPPGVRPGIREEVRLALLAPDEGGRISPLDVEACAIEPKEHAAIYAAVRMALSRPSASALAGWLQYVIIKGSYEEFTVILNVRSIQGPLVKAANALSKTLTRSIPGVAGFFLYEDDSRGEYYMGTRDHRRQPLLRRLYGKETIHQEISGRHFLFSPLSFSQVNLSLAGRLIAEAGDLLLSGTGGSLIDLYCGYGVFAISLAGRAGRVLGVELSASSVQAAIENARRNGVENARFLRDEITGESILRVVRGAGPGDSVLLDPPRNGTAPGVIEGLAARGLRRIVHLFCNIDILDRELKRWRDCGYGTAHLVPFDMFPGTGAVEIMASLEPLRKP